MSLEERAASLSGIDKSVTVSKDFVRKTYIKAKIRKKVIKLTKVNSVRSAQYCAQVEAKAAKEMFMAVHLPRRVVFVDECQFASSTFPTHEWTHLKENLRIPRE
jgi:thymidine kinase